MYVHDLIADDRDVNQNNSDMPPLKANLLILTSYINITLLSFRST